MKTTWSDFLTEGELLAVGIVICIDDSERFLIIRRSDIDERGGQWTIPGGHVDDDDRSIEDGASRELEEETDLVCLVEAVSYTHLTLPTKA